MEKFDFLGNAAIRAGGAAVSTRNVIARAAADIDWERVCSSAKAKSPKVAHAHVKDIVLSI
jgi:hypothetical protein